jgi:hypothetical protein
MSFSLAAPAQTLTRRAFDAHAGFREAALTDRRFRPADLLPLLDGLKQNSLFQVEEIGRSTQNRPIFKVQLGRGPVPVLLWSQMHGDEPTATMALFDVFRFFSAKGDDFDAVRSRLLDRCTLHVVPMLNPDGAEAWKRQTALGIDMNRDALRLQTPEGRLLKRLQQTLKPLVAFNLHDPVNRYSAGWTREPSTLSFLAPAYDETLGVNPVRERAMRLIALLCSELDELIPGKMGRWGIEYEPRAFGDNIQRWGSSLVLIESGIFPNDPEKQHTRRLTFATLLTALDAIATGRYAAVSTDRYERLPENARAIFDLLLRNATVVVNGEKITYDVGVNRLETPLFNRPEKWYVRGTVEDLGDLSTFFGLEEFDATGLLLEPLEGSLKLGGKADFTLKNASGQVVGRVENGAFRRE